jgi:hypothetical protein
MHDRVSLAAGADRHVLYQRAVQEPGNEVGFISTEFRRLRRRRAMTLREDFCGTALVCGEWVKSARDRAAVGVDLSRPTLDWGVRNNLARLTTDQRRRVTLLERNVLDPGPRGRGVDVVNAGNFSWWVFTARADLLRYFRGVRGSLVRDGLFVLDIYGGWESLKEMRERRVVGGPTRGFTYIWDHSKFDPITNQMTAHIHFRMRDGSRLRRAFTYDWRLWTIPETRDALADAGFKKTIVYWEGEDKDGEGDGVFTPAEHAEQCPSFIAYIVALK